MTFSFQRATLYSGVLALLLLTLAACDSQLDLEPQQSISEDAALNTSQNVETVLVGAYELAGDYDLYGGQYAMLADLAASADVGGDVTWTGTFEEPRQVWTTTILVSNAFIADQWLDSYELINVSNNVLAGADLFEDEAERNQIRGEALFLRAAAHFELVRAYAQPYSAGNPDDLVGVPIITEPTRGVGETTNVGRASVQAVYDQVISDLTTAKDLLPDSNPRGTTGLYANTYTASAMLSRVYLNQGNYAGARDEANRVIESGVYALDLTDDGLYDLDGVFENVGGTFSPEVVYGIRFSSQDNGDNSIQIFYGAEENNGRGDININNEHLALYEADDIRADYFFTDEDAVRRTLKWQNENANAPVIRLGEMYLTRAEGNLREGTSVGESPLDDVNTIRARAGLGELSAVTVDDILAERRVELAFEGQILHDLRRTQQDVAGFPFNANRLVYPLPQREVDTNTNPDFTQNPGYGS